MSKEVVPLVVADITPFARALSQQLGSAKNAPSHLALLNMLARAAGFRNFQHMRAAQTAKSRLELADTAVDFRRVERALAQFDEAGCLIRWPSKRHVQELCLWVMWATLPASQIIQEREVNGLLNKAHRFDDAAILRRSLIGMKLVSRNADGSDYLRIEQSPPAEAVALIRHVTGWRVE